MQKLMMLLGSLLCFIVMTTSAFAQDKAPEYIYVDNIVNTTSLTLSSVVLQGETRIINPNSQSGPMTFKFFRPDFVFWMKLTDSKSSKMCALIQVTNYRQPSYVLAGNFTCGFTVDVQGVGNNHFVLTVKNK